MCDPVTLSAASLAMTAASSVASIVAQDQQAKAVADANKRNYDAQMVAYNANIANANWQKTQEAENLSATRIANNQVARRDMAKATVQAGESGIAGLSVDGLLAELGGRAGMANMNAQTQFERRDRAIEMDRMNAWSSTASNINSMKTPMGADYIGAGLRITSAVGDYVKTDRLQKAGYYG